MLANRQTLGYAPGEIVEEAHEHGPSMIPRPNVIVSLVLQEVQKALRTLDREVVETRDNLPVLLVDAIRLEGTHLQSSLEVRTG